MFARVSSRSLVKTLGTPMFSRDAMRAAIPEFLTVHARLPIADNRGGMLAPHLFAAWFLVKHLAPTHIVESGVFKGQGTRLLEQAAPEAKLYCIDPDPAAIEYRSPRASYFTRDFGELDWDLPRDRTLLFFDDHQNALERVRQAERMGFRDLVFEDNYPVGQGDCYSLKQAFLGKEPPRRPGLSGLLQGLTGRRERASAYLERTLVHYSEFPPVVKAATTRWGDAWTDDRYPTEAPLFDDPSLTAPVFEKEARAYTWMCHARLRSG